MDVIDVDLSLLGCLESWSALDVDEHAQLSDSEIINRMILSITVRFKRRPSDPWIGKKDWHVSQTISVQF